MTRRPMPLMSALMLSLGVLPPLPERRVRVQGTAERGGTIFVDDAEIPVHEQQKAPPDQVAQRLIDTGLAEQHRTARSRLEAAEDELLQLERRAMEEGL